MLGCSLEVRPDVAARDGDGSVEGLRRRQGLDHGGRERATLRAVAVLEQGHRPGETPQMQHLDLVGKLNEACQEALLLIDRERCDRPGQGARYIGGCPGAAEPEQPQPGRRERACEAAEIRGSMAGQDITQEMVVDDNRWQLSRGQIGVIEVAGEGQVIVGGQRLVQQGLPGAWREKNDSITQVDDRHAATLCQAPPATNARGHGHLAAPRNEELGRTSHLGAPFTTL